MITMDVKMDDASLKFLQAQAKEFPTEVRRAFRYACGIALRNMRLQMSGRSKRVPRWEAFTKRLRAYQGRRFGGKLMEGSTGDNDKGNPNLTMHVNGDSVSVGWLSDWCVPYSIKFQDGGTDPTRKEWRHYLYSKGWFKPGEVPKEANTPPRPVVENVAGDARKHLAEWTLGAFAGVMDGKIKKWVEYQRTHETESGLKAAKRAARATAIVSGMYHGDLQEIMANAHKYRGMYGGGRRRVA